MSISSLNARINECNKLITEYNGYLDKLSTAKSKMTSLVDGELSDHINKVKKHESDIGFGLSKWEGVRVRQFKETYSELHSLYSTYYTATDDAITKIGQTITKYNDEIDSLYSEISSCKEQIAAIEAAEAAAAASATA